MYRDHLTTRTHTRIFLVRTSHVMTARVAQVLRVSQNHSISDHVSLGCPMSSFPSDFLCTSLFSGATFRIIYTTLTGIRPNPCATPLWHRCLQRAHADQPSDQTHGFPARVRRDNRRFRGPQFTSTFRSIKQQPAHGSKHSSHFVETRLIRTSLRKLPADYDSVASRTCIKETCADMDRKTVLVSKEKTDRDQTL